MPEAIQLAAVLIVGFLFGLLVAIAVWPVAYWTGVHDQARGRVKWPRNRRR